MGDQDKNENGKPNTPPQLAYATFKNQIRQLANEHGVPAIIDNTLFDKMSGTARNQLFQALRYFSLIDKASEPSSELEALASAGDDDEWKSHMKPLLQKYYAKPLEVVAGNGTYSQLRAAFGDIPASALYTGAKFFFQAAKDVGISIPKHIVNANKSPTRTAKPQRQKAKRTGDLSTETPATDDTPSVGMITFPIHFPDSQDAGTIIVPRKLDDAQKRFVAVALKAVRDYFGIEMNGDKDA